MKMLLLIVGLLSLPAYAYADELVRQISISGEASESLKPDLVSLSATVSARNIDLMAAKKEHDGKLRLLLDVAKKFGIKGKYLSTGRASIQPMWKWEKNTQVFKGYTVQTTLNLSSKELDKVGDLLMALVRVKPERMNGPYYRLENAKPVIDRLRVAAASDAKAKAEALAEAAGMKLGKPITISDSWHKPQPLMMRERAMSASYKSAAPVAPPQGEQEVRANVNIVYELKD